MTAGLKPDIAALAESRGVRECLAFFTREKLWIHEQHVALGQPVGERILVGLTARPRHPDLRGHLTGDVLG